MKKNISKVIVALVISAICTGAWSVVEVQVLKSDMGDNEKAHDRIERKVDLLIERLIDN